MILATAFAAPTFASIDGCGAVLATAPTLSPDFSFVESSLEDLGLEGAIEAEEWSRARRFATFLDDPASGAFFDFLGAYADVGFNERTLESVLGQAVPVEDHRSAQIQSILELAVQSELYPAELKDYFVWVFEDGLGPLTYQNRFDLTELRRADHLVKPLDELRRARPGLIWPTMAQLLKHSRYAQQIWIDQAFRVLKAKASDYPQTQIKLQRRLLGTRVFEFPIETKVIDFVENQANMDTDTLLTVYGDRLIGIKRGQRRQRAIKTAQIQVNSALAILLSQIPYHVSQITDADTKLYVESPLGIAAKFEYVMNLDVFMDQGSRAFYRRVLAEVVLRRGSIEGRHARRLVRDRFVRWLRELKGHYERERVDLPRQLDGATTEATSPPLVLDREARIKAYRERLATERGTKESCQTGDSSAADTTSTPCIRSAGARIHRRWARLVDRGRPLAEARRRLATDLPADVPVALIRHRTGDRVNVRFSRELLASMIDPRRGEPRDFRDWLEALAIGPARSQAQRGWKKLGITIDGRFDTEIKLLHSNYRMLGYRRDDGDWYFESIQRMH